MYTSRKWLHIKEKYVKMLLWYTLPHVTDNKFLIFYLLIIFWKIIIFLNICYLYSIEYAKFSVHNNVYL